MRLVLNFACERPLPCPLTASERRINFCPPFQHLNLAEILLCCILSAERKWFSL